MIELTPEQKYYLGQNFRNPKVSVDHIAEKLNVDRDTVNFYICKNYNIFEPYIKLRKELTG